MKNIKIIKLLVLLLLSLTLLKDVTAFELQPKRIDGDCNKGIVIESIPEKNVRDIDRYKNFSTAPSAIKVKFKDEKTGKVLNAIIGSDDLYYFIYKDKGIVKKEDYLQYIEENTNKPLEVNLETLEKIFKTGKSNRSRDYYEKNIFFDVPLTFEQLGVKNEIELLNKYFCMSETFGGLKGKYDKQYNFNPAFIALLIDLGYEVVWGCYRPVLGITTYSFISGTNIGTYNGDYIRESRDR